MPPMNLVPWITLAVNDTLRSSFANSRLNYNTRLEVVNNDKLQTL